jgi:hypothetical protein
LAILNAEMHLDSLGSSICIWVCGDETHTHWGIGQNTSAHVHNTYECAHMHMSSKRIWGIIYLFLNIRQSFFAAWNEV